MKLFAWLRSVPQLDARVADELEREREEYLRRLENNPLAFPSSGAFRRFRRRRGLRTRGAMRWADRGGATAWRARRRAEFGE